MNFCSCVRMKTEWLLLLSLFAAVWPMCLDLQPFLKRAYASLALATLSTDHPSTITPFFVSSRTVMDLSSVWSRRSKMTSL